MKQKTTWFSAKETTPNEQILQNTLSKLSGVGMFDLISAIKEHGVAVARNYMGLIPMEKLLVIPIGNNEDGMTALKHNGDDTYGDRIPGRGGLYFRVKAGILRVELTAGEDNYWATFDLTEEEKYEIKQ